MEGRTMKKLKYIKPLAEVMDIKAEDIIRTSDALKKTVTGSTEALGGIDYDEAYNLSGGNRITLN